MRKVLIIDTSILCVWLEVPGKSTCGIAEDTWDKKRVDDVLKREEHRSTTFVLPLASILETGNHIAQASTLRFEKATGLAEIIVKTAQEESPWAAFTDQAALWTGKGLKSLASEWPKLAAQKLTIGDATIKHVAEHYALMGYSVEILTGDKGLKSYEPEKPPPIPRRRRK